MNKRIMMALALVCVAAPPALAETETKLPGVESILARHVESMGGEKALRTHTSRVTRGSFEIVEMGMGGPMEVYSEAPNKMYMKIEIEGLSTEQAGYDGKTAWMISDMGGPAVLTGDAKAEMLNDADFYLDLNIAEPYDRMEVVGETVWGDQACYEVAGYVGDEVKRTSYFSVETGLFAGFEGKQDTEMGTLQVSSIQSAYREFDGVLIPTVVEQSTMGMTQRITIESVEHIAIDATIFALPEEIAVMVKEDAVD